jgi:DNA-binding winged helix-turn-helix (wHTH) protein
MEKRFISLTDYIVESTNADTIYFIVKNNTSDKYEVKKGSKNWPKSKTGTDRFTDKEEAQTKADEMNESAILEDKKLMSDEDLTNAIISMSPVTREELAAFALGKATFFNTDIPEIIASLKRELKGVKKYFPQLLESITNEGAKLISDKDLIDVIWTAMTPTDRHELSRFIGKEIRRDKPNTDIVLNALKSKSEEDIKKKFPELLESVNESKEAEIWKKMSAEEREEAICSAFDDEGPDMADMYKDEDNFKKIPSKITNVLNIHGYKK